MKLKNIFFVFLYLSASIVCAQVQINPPFSMPDVNIVEFDGRAYAFCGTDLEPYSFDDNVWKMPYWRCFSSDDLVNWRFESLLDPADTYIGKSNLCFAGHGVVKNGKWYWYFSDYVKSTGVAVADSPSGPWKDALNTSLLPSDISPTHEYDNCVFTDDDGKSYMVFGSHVDKKICYHIVELGDDMVSLKGKPVKIEVKDWEKSEVLPVDAPFLHKKNGLYYLSWRSPYAVSESVYGPYRYIGEQSAYGHLGFFTFKNQDYVNYTTLKDGFRSRYRFCSLAYVHYNEDGTIAPMEELIHKNGVGQFDANWGTIEAEWFMDMSDGPLKKQMSVKNKFEIVNISDGDYLCYPNIKHCHENPVVKIKYSCNNMKGGEIQIRAYSANGPLLNNVSFVSTGSWQKYEELEIPLSGVPSGKLSLCFLVKGEGEDIIHIDSFIIN